MLVEAELGARDLRVVAGHAEVLEEVGARVLPRERVLRTGRVVVHRRAALVRLLRRARKDVVRAVVDGHLVADVVDAPVQVLQDAEAREEVDGGGGGDRVEPAGQRLAHCGPDDRRPHHAERQPVDVVEQDALAHRLRERVRVRERADELRLLALHLLRRHLHDRVDQRLHVEVHLVDLLFDKAAPARSRDARTAGRSSRRPSRCARRFRGAGTRAPAPPCATAP